MGVCNGCIAAESNEGGNTHSCGVAPLWMKKRSEIPGPGNVVDRELEIAEGCSDAYVFDR